MGVCLHGIDMSIQGMKQAVQGMTDESRARWAEPAAEMVPGNGGPMQRAAQTGTIISIVVIGVVTLVGILIFSNINQALPETTDPALQNASTGVTEGFAGAMELVPIVMLVLVAALVIGVVQRMRMQA